jgi:hypothetical protein
MLRNKMVRPLNEELAEIGLDPDKTLGDMRRTNGLLDARMRGAHGGGAPSYVRPGAARPPAREVGRTVTEEREPIEEGAENGVELHEALKSVKARIIRGAEKAKGKRAYKKVRSQKKAYGKKYRARNKRKIVRRAAMKARKFGGAKGLAKLHKMRRRIVMQHADSPLANLREDLNKVGGDITVSNSYEDAAMQAGLLALYLGEMFETYGDKQSAETMFSVSDTASDLADAFEHIDGDEELDEEQEEKLQAVLDSMVKGLRVYEAMGSPSLGEIVAVVEGDDEEEGDEDEEDDEEDEDEEDDEE